MSDPFSPAGPGEPGSSVTAQHLSTDHFSGRDRIEAFLELYGRALMRCDIDPMPGHDFELDFAVRSIEGFGIAQVQFSPAVSRHSAAMVDNDDIVLVCPEHGQAVLHITGREVVLSDGEAIFISNDEVGTATAHARVQMKNIRMSRSMLAASSRGLDDALMRKIDRRDPILRLIYGYGGVLGDTEALATPALRHMATQHIHDLAALLLDATQDGAHLASERGLRAARWKAIKADIAIHLTERSLDIAAVCARQQLSPRMLRTIFHGEATTFADYVQRQRLALAHRRLTDPRWDHITISAIAYDVGFGDLSHFNHAFRRHFGATPSDARFAASAGATQAL